MALAVAGVVAMFLPLYNVAGSYGPSGFSPAAEVHLSQFFSTFDPRWMRYGEFDLMIFGTVLAVLTSLRRIGAGAGSKAPILGFAPMAGGAIWMLVDWNSQWSMYSSSVKAYQGLGLWILLGAGVAGVLVCLNDRPAAHPAPAD